MIILLILGVLILLVGVLLFVAPNALSKTSQFLNRKVFDDGAVYTHRVIAGIICVVIGATLLWTSYAYHGVV